MAIIDELMQQTQYAQPTGYDIRMPKGAAYSSYYPAWETTTPQYISPAVYQTEQSAFRVNEFVYSIIIKRAMAEAKGRMRVNRKLEGEKDEEIKDHALSKLIQHPNKGITENMFWGMKRVSQDLAGFSAWEIEYNLLGEPLHLWFMRPDWCSFRRQQQDPLAYIRYQPYGLAPMDIPLVNEQGQQKILFFSDAEDFDPIYPGVRFFSPAMHAVKQIEVDNAMTWFLSDFVKHGAKFAGVLSVAQTIDDATAEDYRRRWRLQHGGADQWADPLILGLGATYSSMQMNFKDMAFPELDARTEVRICDTFQIDPIVADARAGLDVSSYNNKREALKDWYHGWVTDTLDTDAEVMNVQMVPIYEGADSQVSCDFDLSKVYVLQEDRTARWTRAVTAFEKRLITRNTALDEMGLEPLEEGDPEGDAYFEAVNVRPQENVNAQGEVVDGQQVPPQLRKPKGKPALPAPKDAQIEGGKPNQKNGRSVLEDWTLSPEQELEYKKFRKFVRDRNREGNSKDIPNYEFKYLDFEMQAALIAEFVSDPVLVLAWSINNAVEKNGLA